MGREFYSDEDMETELEQVQDLEQERSAYEEMVSKINETGYHERSLQEIEDRQVAADLLGELTWQERAPLEQRVGNVRGMLKYLRGRPGRYLRAEIQLLKTLRQLEVWGEELGSLKPECMSMAEELHFAAERCHFEDALFAATTEFFELVEQLDEPWCV
jgi:hypothetical protein